MGKSAKTFTIDIKILAWLEEYAKKEDKKESYIVNEMLNSAMRQTQTWTCPECNGTNHISEIKCWSSKDCNGVKA